MWTRFPRQQRWAAFLGRVYIFWFLAEYNSYIKVNVFCFVAFLLKAIVLTVSDIIWQGTVGSILDRKDETKTQAIVCQQLGECLSYMSILIDTEFKVMQVYIFIWILEINRKICSHGYLCYTVLNWNVIQTQIDDAVLPRWGKVKFITLNTMPLCSL